MRTRRETAEHPFGTMKMRMGATHFLLSSQAEENGPPGGAKLDSIGLNCWQIQRLVDKRGRAFEIEIAIDVLLYYR